MFSSKHKTSQTTPVLEWIAGAIGAALLAACIGFLIFQGGRGAEEPGAVTIDASRISARGDRYLVEFDVHNTGTQTLVALNVTATLFAGEMEVDSADAVIDYLPGKSMRSGGFYLNADPHRYRLELRAGGYQSP